MRPVTALSITVFLSATLACGPSLGEEFTKVATTVEEAGEEASATRAAGVCPAGASVESGWQGEYPEPILHVQQRVTVTAASEPCGAPSFECTVPEGLYHPWSTVTEAQFRTAKIPQVYRATQPVQAWADSGEVTLPTGTEITIVLYMGEGQCVAEVGGARHELTCPGVAEGDGMVLLSGEAAPDVQLLGVTCAEGRTGWVVDTALLSQPGVAEGQILGYGEVGPAQ